MNFYSEYSSLYIILSFLFSIILSFLYYKKTDVAILPKISLISLRTLSIFTVLILFFITYVFIVKKITSKPVNVFLIDNSRSLTLENRTEELKKSFEIIKSIKNNSSENKYYLFADDMIKEINDFDSLNLNFDSAFTENTDLEKSIKSVYKSLDNRKISTINILSDGIINSGGNPIYSDAINNILCNYLLIGDTVQKKDLSLKNVFFNPFSYLDNNTQITVEFSSYNYNKKIKLSLYEESRPVSEKYIEVNPDNSFYTCSFFIKSNTTGIKKYKVSLENEPDEITDKNNSEEFFIEYLDNKFKILVISGNPSPDFSYLSESLKKIGNFETKFYTQKSSGIFYEGQLPDFFNFNSLILINYPNYSTDMNSVIKLNENLKEINLPVFFISGSNTDYEKLRLLENLIPFASTGKSDKQQLTSVKLVNDLSPEIKNKFNIYNSSLNLPDIFVPENNFNYNPDIQTILYSGRLYKPILFYKLDNIKNSAALLCYNFYKWKLNPTYNNNRDFLTGILNGIILNISNKERDKKILIKTKKQTYSSSETVYIDALINQTVTAENNYSVKLVIYNNLISQEIKTNRISEFNFNGSIKNLNPGEYDIKASLLKNGAEIANDLKKIIISESNLEFKETKANNDILSAMSSKSNGRRINELNIDEINNKIKEKNEKDLKIKEIDNKYFPNSNLIFLLVLILLISAEWYVRKRLNLP